MNKQEKLASLELWCGRIHSYRRPRLIRWALLFRSLLKIGRVCHGFGKTALIKTVAA